MSLRWVIPVIAGCLTACTTTSQIQSKTDRLSPRELESGDCGLFVWTANDAKKFLLFAQHAEGRAIWFNGEKEEYLRTRSVAGEISHKQYPYQTFETPDKTQLTLDLKQPEVITGGTRFKAGTLTMKSSKNWDKVRPVVGLAACQPG